MEQEIQVIQENQEQEVPVEEENVEVVVNRDYNALNNKPSINGVELIGNKTSEDLGIFSEQEIFIVDLSQDLTTANKTSGEIYEATQDDKIAYARYLYNNEYDLVPIVVSNENKATCQILLDTQVTNVEIDEEGNVSTDQFDIAKSSDIPDVSGFATKTEMQTADNNLQGQIDAITASSDVKDIVGTYTDLENYDTSTLGNDDIIKVLEDSTHNDAMTYYRWVITGGTGAWQYIGQEGPYYTKSETNTLLGDKQNTIDSTHKLNADLVDDASSTNKFVTAADKTNWNNKQNALTFDNTPTENSTNPVTSGGVYDSQQEQDTKISKNSSLGNLFTKYKGEATETTINNTEETELKLGLKGNTYQETTTGANLLNVSQANAELSGNSADRLPTMEYTETGYTMSGYAGGAWFKVPCEIGKSYKLKFNTNGNFTNIRIFNKDKSSTLKYVSDITSGEKTINLDTTTEDTIYFRTWRDAGDTTATLYYAMISEDVTDYEPYTNGASPNPDYPQDIQVVTGNNQIDISNKNLFDKNNAYDSSLFSASRYISDITYNNGILTVTPTGTGNPRLLIRANIKSGSYTLNSATFLSDATQLRKDNEDVLYTFQNKYSNQQFTITEDATKMCFNFSNPNNTNPFQIDLNTLQIEKGSNASEFVEHQEQNYPISLGNIELCKIGDYQDYIHKSGNKWYLHKEINKVVLDGTEYGWDLDTNNGMIYNNQRMNGVYLIQNAYSNYYTNVVNENITNNYYANQNMQNNQFSFRVGTKDRIYIKDTTYSDIATYKAWLGTHNLIVYYVLATPTETEITDTTLISQLNNLEYATTYKEQTNINQVNDDMPFWLDYETFKPITDVNSYAGIIVPDTTNMTPIKTVEYDVSSNAYFKFMSVANNFTSMDDQYGDCVFRITVSGENIAKNIIEGIYSIRQGENAVPYFAVRNKAGAGTTNSAITGIRYIRVNYPKEMNNGYNYDLEFNCINSNTRHIKIEVFKTTPNITWYDSLTSTTFDSTYQTTTPLTISTTNVISVLGSYTMTVSNANVASYINSYLPKFPSGTLPKAGQAISAQQFIFFSDDNEAYPSSNKTKPIKTGIGIQLCSNNVNLNSSVPNSGLRQKYNNSTLTNIPHATLTAGDDCWFRCTMDANGNIYSDNYVDTERTPGYTWYFVGIATSATAINTDTTQSKFYTLDANGKLTHIDGLEIA